MSTIVTADNFNRAETHRYFTTTIKLAGGLGRFDHARELMPVESQRVIHGDRDTLLSAAVFDLDAGAVTIVLPDAGSRYMSMTVLDEDQYSPLVAYIPGSYTFARDQFRTRYVMVGIRTLVDPGDPEDVAQAHILQDDIAVYQKSRGHFEAPEWDPVSLRRIRDALLQLAPSVPDSRRMFGARDEVDPVRHMIGTAAGWGGPPEIDSLSIPVTPERNDGTTIHWLTVKDAPVGAFWSISVYNANGYFEPNRYGAYTVNSLTAKKRGDRSIVVQFGGYDGKVENCLPICRGWTYMVRLYRPHPEILSGAWTFPAAVAFPSFS